MTAKKLWEAIKWSNRNPDGSVSISLERVKLIDEVVKNEADKG
jgi:hypothetical protein